MPYRKSFVRARNSKIALADQHLFNADELLKTLHHEYSDLGKAIRALEAVQRIRACRLVRPDAINVLRSIDIQ
jgi:hypothetical protein